MQRLAGVLLTLAALGVAGWGALLLWFAGPGPAWLRAALAAAAVVGALGARFAVRPLGRSALAVAGVLALLLVFWSSLRPSHGRVWQPDVARLATATIEGDRVIVENVRNFHYRSETDYDPSWETRSYDLGRLDGLDLYTSDWGAPGVVHTILSWRFEDAPPLAISIETRKEEGEAYSALAGFFRQYELVYVAADERDVIRLRTDFRKEEVRLYPLRVTRERARDLLLDYLATMNAMAREARWYNALTTNCTTTIRTHTGHLGAAGAWSWKLLANEYLDELLYERGLLDTGLPLERLREASRVGERARAAGAGADFRPPGSGPGRPASAPP